ncbi:MAG: alpha-amylase, partial [Halobacteriales archaeon]
MHHPGPPRFTAVGEVVELAPRDPDPAGEYRWRLTAAPAASTVRLGGDPIVRFAPDAPGTYTAELWAPDGTHEVTVRALPGAAGATARGGRSGRSGGGLDDRGRAAENTVSGGPGAPEEGGRPRIRLEARRMGGTVVVEADPRPNPAGGERSGDLDVAFVLDDRDDLRPADVETGDRALRIPTDRLPERARVHAVAVGPGG